MSAPTFTPSVHYQYPKAALLWLENAFSFEITMAIDGPDDAPEMCHYEMSSEGNGVIYIGGEWTETIRSPAKNSGVTTQTVHVKLQGSVDDHCDQARDAGAIIDREPEDQFYGDRTYTAVDPEGHRWVFSQQVREVPKAEAESVIGQKIYARDWR